MATRTPNRGTLHCRFVGQIFRVQITTGSVENKFRV